MWESCTGICLWKFFFCTRASKKLLPSFAFVSLPWHHAESRSLLSVPGLGQNPNRWNPPCFAHPTQEYVCFQGNFGSSFMQILAWYISSQPQRALFMLLRVLVGFGASLFYKGFQQNGQFFGPSCLKDWKMLVPVVKLIKKDWTNQISIIIVIFIHLSRQSVRQHMMPQCHRAILAVALWNYALFSDFAGVYNAVYKADIRGLCIPQLGTVPDMSTFHFPSDSQWKPKPIHQGPGGSCPVMLPDEVAGVGGKGLSARPSRSRQTNGQILPIPISDPFLSISRVGSLRVFSIRRGVTLIGKSLMI